MELFLYIWVCIILLSLSLMIVIGCFYLIFGMILASLEMINDYKKWK